MSRKVSARARKHVQAEIDPLVFVFLITISHPSLTEPIRVSSDRTQILRKDDRTIYYGTVSNGQTFYYAGFEASLVNDEDSSAPKTSISIPNADRSMIEAIESLGSGAVGINIKLVFADTPDIIEQELDDMEMSEITYDETTISGTISRDLLFAEPHPFYKFIPQHYPFLFLKKRV